MKEQNERKYERRVIYEAILSKVNMDPKVRMQGYNQYWRQEWRCEVVHNVTGEAVLEVIILPDTVVVWNKEKMLCSTGQVNIVLEEGKPIPKTSSGRTWTAVA